VRNETLAPEQTLQEVAVAIGTRPEAIKLMPVIRALEGAGFTVRVFGTGQHRELLDPILEELEIAPIENLEVMREEQSLARLSARVLEGCRDLLRHYRPQLLVVQGDTTSAAMSALAAFYEGIPVAHVEAGLRTHSRRNPFPEEMNRKLIACLADLHFAPTPGARRNLVDEGVPAAQVHVVGNTVIDVLVHVRDEVLPGLAPDRDLEALVRPECKLVLVTGHRRESSGPDLAATCEGIARLAGAFRDRVDVVFPVHLNPSVRAIVHSRLSSIPNLELIEPLTYVPFLRLMLRARLIITDSGGIQEEAAFLGIPTLVTRRTSERPEAIDAGVAQLTDSRADTLFESARVLLTDEAHYRSRAVPTTAFGDGRAAKRIAEILLREGT